MNTPEFTQETYAVLCMQSDGGIGKNNELLFKRSEIPNDMGRFVEKRKNHVLFMGRLTYESVPIKYRRMEGTIVVVITKDKDYKAQEGIQVRHDPVEALKEMKAAHRDKHMVVGGGGQIYKQLFPYCDRLYVTNVEPEVVRDSAAKIEIPQKPDQFYLFSSEPQEPGPGIKRYDFEEWINVAPIQ